MFDSILLFELIGLIVSAIFFPSFTGYIANAFMITGLIFVVYCVVGGLAGDRIDKS